jgi:DNA polymerase III subunit alpha
MWAAPDRTGRLAHPVPSPVVRAAGSTQAGRECGRPDRSRLTAWRRPVPSGPTSSADSFVHLHNHTEYSMLDGAAKIDDLFAEAARMGMPAVATTDHGFVFGAYEFWKKSKKHGVKPIIGVEAYLTPGTARRDRTRVRWGDGGGDDVSGTGAYTHMTMWAQNTTGMHNLFRLASLASLEGQFYKPRMDRELLETYHDGLIATTGCPSGEVQTRLRLGQYQEAVEAAAQYRDLFGADNFFCEVMDHGLGIERRIQKDLIRLAKELGLPLVATNDLHYTRPEDAKAHAVLLCVQSGSTLADPKRFKFDADEFYLKSPEEMRQVWAEHPEACDNTLAIAERCDISFTESVGSLMPRFPCPPGESEESWFVKEVEVGLHKRFPGGIPADVRKQAGYEIEVITSKGYAGYFLVVADFINWSKENGIRVGPGRGSGAGSMAAYAMKITDLDPLRHGLIFERFLNPERMSMPDFDVDFDERRRGEVIKYVTEKYGEDRVAQIVTYGTIKAKQALKDAGRVLGYPFSLGERMTKAMPPAVMGKDIPLYGIFDDSHPRYKEAEEFRQLHAQDEDVKRVVETARGLEGLKRQWGVHAAGVIMSSEPLIDHIPIMRREQDGAIITQFDYPTCENLGLVKMDFLGLRNLTILDDALENIELNGKPPVVVETLELTDPKTYELLGRGDTLGVFQFDGGPMRQLLRLMRPDNFEDISAVGALYRPGPMGANSHTNYALRKNKQQEISYPHPELAEALEPILGTTYGLIVYQEQVMAIAQQLAGYTLGKADLLRRAMGKKKREVLDAEYVGFEAGMIANGFSPDSIKTLWEVLVPFSDYAFNKAHSAAYGVVSYWTAYLKANYPAEYMAAVLTSVRDDKDKSALYLNECRRLGIKVLPPDVNSSSANFTPVDTDIRFGLTAIRNVGANVVEEIVRAREEKGRFESFEDFLRKVPAVVCNKRTIESLIKAGAFDSLGQTRKGLVSVHEQAVDAVISDKRQEAMGQDSLFGGLDDAGPSLSMVPEVPPGEWDKTVLLAAERDMLGLYVSDHPLFGVEHILTKASDCSISALTGDDGLRDGATVTIAGMISSLQRKLTKNGNPWAIASVEDLGGAIEVLFFPQTYQTVLHVLAEDLVVIIKGRVNRRDEVPTIYAQELTIPDLTVGTGGPVVLSMPVSRCTHPTVEKLKDVLSTHPGATEVHLKLTQTGRSTTMRLDDRLRVTPSPALFGDLKALLGPSCLV